MDRDATPAPRLGTLSLTPVTRGTQWLQVVLEEHVSQMACGQGLIQLVHVSPPYVILYPLHKTIQIIHYVHTNCKYMKELI